MAPGPFERLHRFLTSELDTATMEQLVQAYLLIDEAEIEARGRTIQAMRDAGASWREIGRATDEPQSTMRYFHNMWLEQVERQQ